ncbi:MAG: hypothetical protein K2Q14_04875 [Gammaproteobacteria bacterium]|nr:hypothetical protein [Gammaproteobacteria bacterium]
MSNDDYNKLLVLVNHDLINIFSGAAVACSASDKYYKQLVSFYRNASKDEKSGIEIPETILDLVEKNLGNIKKQMDLGNLYIKSLRYNFCDYKKFSNELLDVKELVLLAKYEYETKFMMDLPCKVNLSSEVDVYANRELLTNIILRFFMLDISSLNRIILITTDGNYCLLEFVYQNIIMGLPSDLSILKDPLMETAIMKMPFNLSLCMSYVAFLGGRVDIWEKDGETYFDIYIPKRGQINESSI